MGYQTNFRASDFKHGDEKKATKKAAAKKAVPAPAVNPDEVPEGTTAEVLDWVAEDPKRAAKALEVEQANEDPRVTLVEPLEKITAPAKKEPAKKATAKKA